MATTTARQVHVLGREVDGNREVIIIEASQEYDLDFSTVVTYTTDTAQFPYTL